jgi:hypothetical protein
VNKFVAVVTENSAEQSKEESEIATLHSQ